MRTFTGKHFGKENFIKQKTREGDLDFKLRSLSSRKMMSREQRKSREDKWTERAVYFWVKCKKSPQTIYPVAVYPLNYNNRHFAPLNDMFGQIYPFYFKHCYFSFFPIIFFLNSSFFFFKHCLNKQTRLVKICLFLNFVCQYFIKKNLWNTRFFFQMLKSMSFKKLNFSNI